MKLNLGVARVHLTGGMTCHRREQGSNNEACQTILHAVLQLADDLKTSQEDEHVTHVLAPRMKEHTQTDRQERNIFVMVL